MKLRHKFALNGLIPLVLAISMMTGIIFFMLHLQTNAKDDMRLLLTAEQLHGSLITVQQSIESYEKLPSDQSGAEILEGIKKTSRLIGSLQPFVTRTEIEQRIEIIHNEFMELDQSFDMIIANREEIDGASEEARIRDILLDVRILKDSMQIQYEKNNAELQQKLQMAIILAALGCVAMILISTGMSVRIYRGISRSIQALQQVIVKVEKGDLSAQADIVSGDELGELATSFNSMIRERRMAEDTIAHMAYHDELTGLGNRYDFYNQLQTSSSGCRLSGKHIGILFFDLDYFKKINDTLGHSFGDQILKVVAKRISERLQGRASLYRMGGDEFIVMMPEVDGREQISDIGGAILEELKEPVCLEDLTIHLSTSIGAAMYPEDGTDADTLIKNADIAMYHVKESGRGGFRFYRSELAGVSVEQLILAGELHQALEQQQLVVHYQPQMDVHTGKVSGFEALVRWQHPDKGLIPPGTFIPIAEQSGLINRIGEYVLRTACTQMKAWMDAGLVSNARMSVNLSSRQFIHHNPVEEIRTVLAETKLKPSCLEIEITESMTMNVQRAKAILDDLKLLGVCIAIDDFGTGYSSLNYLKTFPIDRLKIDRSFVRDISEDANDRAIVATIIAMAKTLELSVTAEGVEQQEQLQFLGSQHCDEIQGYYFSRPLPGSQVEAMLVERLEARNSPGLDMDLGLGALGA